MFLSYVVVCCQSDIIYSKNVILTAKHAIETCSKVDVIRW